MGHDYSSLETEGQGHRSRSHVKTRTVQSRVREILVDAGDASRSSNDCEEHAPYHNAAVTQDAAPRPQHVIKYDQRIVFAVRYARENNTRRETQ